MEKAKLGNKVKAELEDQTSLKNAIASVLLTGFFLIAAWVGIYFRFFQSF